MHGVIDAVTSGASTDPNDLIANLQAFQVRLAALHDTWYEESGAELAAPTQGKSERREWRVTEGEVASIAAAVWAEQSDGADFRDRPVMRVHVARRRRRAVCAAAVRHGQVSLRKENNESSVN